jgi:hypothetical protein
MDFIRGNTVFTVNEHPESREPLLQGDWRVLEDRKFLDGELAAAIATLPALRSFQVIRLCCILANTVRAARAIGPSHCSYSVNADLFVAKVANRLL